MRESSFFETNLPLCPLVEDSMSEIESKFVQMAEKVKKSSQRRRAIYNLFDFSLLHFHISKG
jgi:hypothetical protein